MKRKISISAMAVAALAMLATSCSSELEGLDTTTAQSNGAKQQMTFTATQESNSGVTSKSAISSDGTAINWQSGDAITVWDGTDKSAFTVTPLADATTATITGTVTAGSTAFTAVYPNSVGQNCTYAEGTIEGVVIPATQTATAGSYDPTAAVMTAYTEVTNLPFKNVCSFLKITAGAAYSKIVVTVTSGSLAGTFSITNADADDPTLTATTGLQTVTLSGTITQGNTYYIAFAPGSVSGFTVDCYTDATHYLEKTLSSFTFKRSNSYNLGSTSDEGWKTKTVIDYVTITSADGTKTMKWATMNLGATTVADAPETAFGDYYAWGATETWYNNKSGITYTWNSTQSKYDVTFASTGFWKDGYTDGYSTKHVPTVAGEKLSSTEDIATITYPGWRMATKDEFQWLADACNTGSGSYSVTNVASTDAIPTAKGIYWIAKRDATYKVPGMLFIDKNGASVFFPAAGNVRNMSLSTAGKYGSYWSSLIYSASVAYYLNLYSGCVDLEGTGLSYRGLTVRPVSE